MSDLKSTYVQQQQGFNYNLSCLFYVTYKPDSYDSWILDLAYIDSTKLLALYLLRKLLLLLAVVRSLWSCAVLVYPILFDRKRCVFSVSLTAFWRIQNTWLESSKAVVSWGFSKSVMNKGILRNQCDFNCGVLCCECYNLYAWVLSAKNVLYVVWDLMACRWLQIFSLLLILCHSNCYLPLKITRP